MVGSLGSLALSQPPSPTPELNANRSTDGLDRADSPINDQDQEVEFLTRGPMHEAFAEPYQANPEETLVVAKQPPEPINELPPNYRPEGNDVAWIPGYWAWDDERTDFIWISGVWRDFPPGQQWIPGYWHQVPTGYQYVGGFWIGGDVADVAYLPTPPASLDQGPSSPSPGENYFYIPGSWAYQNSDYQWQPGYWSPAQEDWVWNPTRYVWTPSGCVHQSGYWDYDVPNRGVLFSPVYYRQPIYQNANYNYRPQYAINTGLGLFANIFLGPRNSRYYFGDYYGSQFGNRYQPWVTRFHGRGHYDPFYSSYANRGPASFSGNRGFGGTNLITWIGNQHQQFANNAQYRPAPTISAQRQFLLKNRNTDIDPTTLHLASMGDSFQNLVKSNDLGLNFQRLDQTDLDAVRDDITPLRQLERERAKSEGSSAKANAGLAEDHDLARGDKPADAPTESTEARSSLRVPGRDRAGNGDRDRTRNSTGDLESPKNAGRDRTKGENGSAQTEDRPVKSSDKAKPTPDSGNNATPDRGTNEKASSEKPNPGKRGNASDNDLPGAKRRGDSAPQDRDREPLNPDRLDDLRAARPDDIPTPLRDRNRPIPNRPGADAASGNPAAPAGDAPAAGPRNRPDSQGRPSIPQLRPDAPQKGPEASSSRPVAPRARPDSSQGRADAPKRRPEAVQGRPEAPQKRPDTPQVRPPALNVAPPTRQPGNAPGNSPGKASRPAPKAPAAPSAQQGGKANAGSGGAKKGGGKGSDK